jgi:hypothetical protein
VNRRLRLEKSKVKKNWYVFPVSFSTCSSQSLHKGLTNKKITNRYVSRRAGSRLVVSAVEGGSKKIEGGRRQEGGARDGDSDPNSKLAMHTHRGLKPPIFDKI